jgi:putative nucleotidyltransferase with HDIG domain
MTSLSTFDVVSTLRDLPALPAIVAELLGSLDRDDAGTKLLAEKLSHDQALTAKTLRLANSSFYGMQNKVTTIQQAIAILGFNSVRTLVIAASITGCFPMDGPGSFNFKAFWRHSVGTALCAKGLARHMPVNQDQAFMVGLLHDIGRLVLVTRCPELFEDVVKHRAEHDCYLLDAERAVLGIDHAAVGEALAVHWKFPVTMQRAIAEHHALNRMTAGSLTYVAHVADALAHALDLSGIEDDLVPPVTAELEDDRTLNRDIMNRVCRETEAQFDEVCKILVP